MPGVFATGLCAYKTGNVRIATELVGYGVVVVLTSTSIVRFYTPLGWPLGVLAEPDTRECWLVDRVMRV